MRIVLGTMALGFFVATATVGGQQPQFNPGTTCGRQSKGLPDFYYETVVRQIRPPEWPRSLIRISLGGERKLVLMTDGEKYELWTDTPDVPQGSIGEFLANLNESCRLPADPGKAVALISFKWETKELSRSKFEQLHLGFTRAVSAFASKAQRRYASLIKTKMGTIHLDSSYFQIVYDNDHEHIELGAWLDNADKTMDPVVKWSRDLNSVGRESFHRPFGRE